MKKILLFTCSILFVSMATIFAQGESNSTSTDAPNKPAIEPIGRFTLVVEEGSTEIYQTFNIFAKKQSPVWLIQDIINPDNQFTAINLKAFNELVTIDLVPEDATRFAFTQENHLAFVIVKISDDGESGQAYVKCPIVINLTTGIGKKICTRDWKPIMFPKADPTPNESNTESTPNEASGANSASEPSTEAIPTTNQYDEKPTHEEL